MSKRETAAAKEVQRQKLELDPKYIIKLTGTLLGISAVVALLLGVVNQVTAPIIDEIQAEKTAAAMSQVLEAEDYLPLETEAEGVTALYEARTGGEPAGYVVEVSGSGYGGAIQMVVGVDLSGTVTGVSVTDHGETSNVGTKVVESEAVLGQFVGMSLADGEITVNSGTNRFDGVSGATVSSRGVVSGVNTALAAVAGLAE